MMTREKALLFVEDISKFLPACRSDLNDMVDALSTPEWINVNEDIPSNHEDMYNMSGSLIYTDDVLALTDSNKPVVLCMMFNDNTGEWNWNKPGLNIKYWMRIPKLNK